MVAEVGEHPAAESLLWISRLQQLVAERPEKFTKVVTTAEKKVLQELLERALGVSRRRPAQPKPARNRAPVARKQTPRKTKPDAGAFF
jgi:hypothetical protein